MGGGELCTSRLVGSCGPRRVSSCSLWSVLERGCVATALRWPGSWMWLQLLFRLPTPGWARGALVPVPPAREDTSLVWCGCTKQMEIITTAITLGLLLLADVSLIARQLDNFHCHLCSGGLAINSETCALYNIVYRYNYSMYKFYKFY